ncbi:MAG: hypothetical protein ABW221_00430 [Vicinamibacteria bacterium]
MGMAANGVDGRLGRYLLGHLSPEEEERLEIEYLAGADAFVLVQEAEHDLIDDYVAGRLSSDDVQRFEQRLLPRPEMEERIAFARALAAAQPVRRAAARPWLGAAAAAVLALVSAGLGAGLLQQQRARDAAQSRIDALERVVAAQQQRLQAVPVPRPEAAPPAASPRVVELRGGASRGEGDGGSEIEEPGAGWLQVRLKMDEHLYGSYKATLERPEGTVLAPLPVVRNESPVGAEVMLPGALLKPGTYVIVLRARNGDLVDGYPLQVRPVRSR